MLIRFNVKNFLSFNETDNGESEEFSMIAGKVRKKNDRNFISDDSKLKLLKIATIFGGNAAGKSNFVKAMRFMKDTIVFGLPKHSIDKFCKASDDNKNKVSYFEIQMIVNDKYYSYGFEVLLSEGRFTSEWLVELLDDKEKIIFERNVVEAKIDISETIREGKDRLSIYSDDIKANSDVLLLTVMNSNKGSIYEEYEDLRVFKNVFLWIRNKLDIHYPNRPISNYSYMENSEDVKDVCNIISSFGTGIKNFKMVDVDPQNVIKTFPEELKNQVISDLEDILKKSKINQNSTKDNKSTISNIVGRSNKDFFTLNILDDGALECKTIKFFHENKNTLFDLAEESDGTIRILDLIEILLSDEDKIYVIDELDRCLHPNLTYKFIESFLKIAQRKNIQLIVTTHESRLLDFDLLRRDEIWFINKNHKGYSNIYSLDEFNERFDKKIDKAYLDGRYGGVPIFDAVFPI